MNCKKINLWRLNALLLLCFVVTGCTSTRVVTNREVARVRCNEPILLVPPLSSNLQLKTVCEKLGTNLNVQIPKRANGQVVYGENIDSLNDVLIWENLIINGVMDCQEVATIARTVGCKSAITCQILDSHLYPPFRMVVSLLWIDAATGDVIGKLYNDVDLNDSDIQYRYSNFVGHGPAKRVYERIFYSEDLLQTAMLSPDVFIEFVAAYSTQVMFGDIYTVPWYYFWRSF